MPTGTPAPSSTVACGPVGANMSSGPSGASMNASGGTVDPGGPVGAYGATKFSDGSSGGALGTVVGTYVLPKIARWATVSSCGNVPAAGLPGDCHREGAASAPKLPRSWSENGEAYARRVSTSRKAR